MKMTDISEGMLDALIDQGNRALNDFYHERACSCDGYPAKCATPSLFFGLWDTDAFAVALPAIIARYEELKNRTDENLRFEVGKTYRRVRMSHSSLATVVSVSDMFATGRWDNGNSWVRPHKERSLWEEVGVSINADQHKNLSNLGVDLGDNR
jgi:hypothetical protein